MQSKSMVRIKVWIGKVVFYAGFILAVWSSSAGEESYSLPQLILGTLVILAGIYTFSVKCEKCGHIWYQNVDPAKKYQKTLANLDRQEVVNLIKLRMPNRCLKCGQARY